MDKIITSFPRHENSYYWDRHQMRLKNSLFNTSDGAANVYTPILDERGVRFEILMREGDRRGEYRYGSDVRTAIIPGLQSRIKEIKGVRFERQKYS